MANAIASPRLVYLEPGLPPLPEDLLLARDRGEVLFLTGAGVSTPPPSSLPSFRGLVVEICDRLDAALAEAMRRFVSGGRNAKWEDYVEGLDATQQTELKRFAIGDYDVVLGMLERRTSEPSSSSRMRKIAVDVLNAAHQPNVLHKSLNRLARRFGQHFIATTNFDRLHEAAALRAKEIAPKSFGLTSLPRPSRRRDFAGIFHIHGVLPERASLGAELVLTEQDFGDAYLRRRIAADFIYDAIRIFHLVIIGYSMNDAPLRYLLNAVAGDSVHFPDLKSRYAIVPRSGSDQTLAMDWSARAIEPISYDDSDGHRQLQTLMKAWADSVPQPETTTDDWARGKLKRMSKTRFVDASPEDRSVFGYVLRRASRGERIGHIAYLSEIGAHPDWLTQGNQIARSL